MPKPHPTHGLASTPTKPVGASNDRFTTPIGITLCGVATNSSYVVDVVDPVTATGATTAVDRWAAVTDVVDVTTGVSTGGAIVTARVVPRGSMVAGFVEDSTPASGVSVVGTGVVVGCSADGVVVSIVVGGVVDSCAYATPPNDIIATMMANPVAMRRMVMFPFQVGVVSGTYGCSSANVKSVSLQRFDEGFPGLVDERIGHPLIGGEFGPLPQFNESGTSP